MRSGPKLGQEPPTRLADSRTCFLGHIPELFLKVFVGFARNAKPGFELPFVHKFPGKSRDSVGSAGVLISFGIFVNVPGSAAKTNQEKQQNGA